MSVKSLYFAIPACLAGTSWRTVITGDSLPILIICPFWAALISSKLSACYAPYLLWCHFCPSSHWTVAGIISCQQKRKTLLVLSPSPSLIVNGFSVSWNLPSSSICAVPLFLSSFFTVHQFASVTPKLQWTSQIPACDVSVHLKLPVNLSPVPLPVWSTGLPEITL